MTTQKQIVANQLNALQSTGPTTLKGKATVAKNALKHGFFSKRILLEGESEEEFEIFKTHFFEQLQPQGFLELLLCERALVAAWRLSRITQMEAMLIDQSAKNSFFGRGMTEVLSAGNREELALLSRYEITLEKILFRSLGELRVLQMARRFDQTVHLNEIGFVPQKITDMNV